MKNRLKEVTEKKSRKKVTVTEIYNVCEEKTKMTKLDSFLKTYNYYIHKLLWSNADPYLAAKRKKY